MRLPPFLVYAMVGMTGTGVQYLILVTLVSVGLAGPVFASTTGAIAGAIVNYRLNYRFTFHSNKKHLLVAPRFFLVALLGAGVNWLVMKNSLYLFNIHYVSAQCIATATVLIFTFSVNRAWSFNTKLAGTNND